MPTDTDDTQVAPDGTPAGIGHGTNPLERGNTVGRYVVLDELGAGGMGVVYGAYDPELNRKIALKLLRPGRSSSPDASDGHRRLLREAQAMAKLSHPNVIAVHDVGVHRGRVFVAMEFVEGSTLGAWLDERDRDLRSILETFELAGEGLAAAHDKGLVHRDFKPDNVMVDADGRVRVMDFGLASARSVTGDDELRESAQVPEAEADPLGATMVGHSGEDLTQTGALLGTPAFMAPEQWNRHDADARSDQFSFCVALYRAVYGVAPFAGDRIAALSVNVTEGRVRPPPAGTGVPKWLRAIILRGLSVDPDQRFASMRALLDALSRGRTRARRRRWSMAGAGVGLMAMVAAALVGLEERRQVEACEASGAAIHDLWDRERRTEVHSALSATDGAWATTTAETTLALLDDRAADWQAARVDACLDGTVRHVWTADTLARSTRCFDEHEMALAALVEELSRPDPDVRRRAVEAASSLDSAMSCREPNVLQRRPDPPPDRVDEIQAIRRDLSRVGAYERSGQYEAGLELATRTVAQARKLGWSPLTARAEYHLGELQERRGEYELASESLARGYFAAAKAGADDVAVDAATSSALVSGVRLARYREGVLWADHADVALDPLEPVPGARAATRFNVLGQVHGEMGDYERARELYERAEEIWIRISGEDSPQVATVLSNLGLLAWTMGDYDEAVELQTRVIDIRVSALGDGHPDLAASFNNLAVVHESRGDPEAAIALYERAASILEATYGPEHPDVAMSLNNIAVVYEGTGRPAQARELHARALQIWSAQLGDDHPLVAKALNNLAVADETLGDFETAERRYRRALEIQIEVLGDRHPDVAMTLNNIGANYEVRRDYEAARDHFRRAAAIIRASQGETHPTYATITDNIAWVSRLAGDVDEARRLHGDALRLRESILDPGHADIADSLYGLCEVELSARAPGRAIEHCERALSIREATEVGEAALAQARFGLARALWAAPPDAGRDRSRARELATLAERGYANSEGQDAERETVAQWLAAPSTDSSR